MNPMIFLGDKEFSENDIYIGLDIDKENIKAAKSAAKSIIESGNRPAVKNYMFMAADMRRLPLSDGSVDELFLGNVLGDSSIWTGNKNKLFKEIKRVLKYDGSVIIKETYTPFELEELDKLLKTYNFQIIRSVIPGDKEWDEEVQKYNRIEKENPYRYSYIVYAKQL